MPVPSSVTLYDTEVDLIPDLLKFCPPAAPHLPAVLQRVVETRKPKSQRKSSKINDALSEDPNIGSPELPPLLAHRA